MTHSNIKIDYVLTCGNDKSKFPLQFMTNKCTLLLWWHHLRIHHCCIDSSLPLPHAWFKLLLSASAFWACWIHPSLLHRLTFAPWWHTLPLTTLFMHPFQLHRLTLAPCLIIHTPPAFAPISRAFISVLLSNNLLCRLILLWRWWFYCFPLWRRDTS